MERRRTEGKDEWLQWSLRLAVLMMATMAATPCAAADRKGDVNGDGMVTTEDAIRLTDCLNGKAGLDAAALVRADGNSDGAVDVADVIWIQLNEVTIMLPGGVLLVLMRIPPGSFVMGSPESELNRGFDESPAHVVTIGYDYYMAKHEMNQAQWFALMTAWPSEMLGSTYSPHAYGPNFPIYYVTWNEAKQYIAKLNQHIQATGQGRATFRLPSEAEWEYACRGWTQTRFSFGDAISPTEKPGVINADCVDDGLRDLHMWFCGNNGPSGSTTWGRKQVGQKLPNAFGLHDMHGNVMEWCEDGYMSNYAGAPTDGSAWKAGDSPVVRGGSAVGGIPQVRSAARTFMWPDFSDPNLGFRVVWMR